MFALLGELESCLLARLEARPLLEVVQTDVAASLQYVEREPVVKDKRDASPLSFFLLFIIVLVRSYWKGVRSADSD